MRSIGVITTSRADYGIYRPLLRRLHEHPELELRLYVSGAHLSPEFGHTIDAILADGFAVHERIEMLLSGDTPQAIGKAMGLACGGFAQSFARSKPDLLVVLGDRYEMFAAALASVPFNLPLVHLHGGELTEGAMDEAFRHSLTKFSHLHCVATEVYRRRVIQLGEEPWRVVLTGALGLDSLAESRRWTREELETRFGLQLDPPPLLVTFHPITTESEQTLEHAEELLAALVDSAFPVVFTAPNADTHGRVVRAAIEAFCARHAHARSIENFGPEAYFSMMACAAAMVGNSSSGIIEAASFKLPVVNVGNRQRGRLRASNVIDVGYGRQEIAAAIRKATTPEFRKTLEDLVNPYGDGRAAERVVDLLEHTPIDVRLRRKHFHDLPLR